MSLCLRWPTTSGSGDAGDHARQVFGVAVFKCLQRFQVPLFNHLHQFRGSTAWREGPHCHLIYLPYEAQCSKKKGILKWPQPQISSKRSLHTAHAHVFGVFFSFSQTNSPLFCTKTFPDSRCFPLDAGPRPLDSHWSHPETLGLCWIRWKSDFCFWVFSWQHGGSVLSELNREGLSQANKKKHSSNT